MLYLITGKCIIMNNDSFVIRIIDIFLYAAAKNFVVINAFLWSTRAAVPWDLTPTLLLKLLGPLLLTD